MRFTDVGQQGKVRPSLTNEVEADKLFPVFEVFRFDSQVGFYSNFNRTWSTLYFKLTLSYNHKTAKQICNTKNSAFQGDKLFTDFSESESDFSE